MTKWDIHNYDDTAHFLYNVRSYIVSLFFELAKKQNMENISLLLYIKAILFAMSATFNLNAGFRPFHKYNFL